MNLSFIEPTNWYVLYTLPNYEKKVYSSLEKQKILAFLPLQKVERKWSDRKRIIDIPLFPNYIFVNTPRSKRFKVLDTFGVKYYITRDGQPVVVNEKEIRNIRQILEGPNLDVEQNLVKGDFVTINEGPFKEMQGVIYERKGQTRFCVKIESINQVLSIDVCSTWIKPVKS